MSDHGINKRKHMRVYFNAGDMLKLHIGRPRLNKTPFMVNVMNISQSGLCFLMPQGSDDKINEGDPLVFEKIDDVQILKPIRNVDMIVRWSFREKEFDHQVYGCEFLNMRSSYSIYLRTFIRQQIKGNGLKPQIGSTKFNA